MRSKLRITAEGGVELDGFTVQRIASVEYEAKPQGVPMLTLTVVGHPHEHAEIEEHEVLAFYYCSACGEKTNFSLAPSARGKVEREFVEKIAEQLSGAASGASLDLERASNGEFPLGDWLLTPFGAVLDALIRKHETRNEGDDA